MPESENSNSKPINVWLPLLLSLMTVVGMVIGARLSKSMDRNYHSASNQLLFQKGEPSTLEEVMRFIDARYVDEVDEDEISQELIDQLLNNLDPHSNYLSPESVQRVNEDLEGNFSGIGIEFIILEDTINVIKPTPGGPSERAGILAGDKIIAVDDSLIAGQSIAQDILLNMIRGKQGSEVELSLKRKGLAELKNVEVKREAIPIHSLDAAYEIEPGVLFTKLNRFSATTYREFMEGIEKIIDEKQSYQLIIDLRNNPGGYLNEAVDILCQIFEEKDKLMVYTKGSNTRKLEYNTTGRNFFQIESVAILIDEGSASASEIIAGAIQDWDRGYIVGRRTFGKGLVQEQYPLRNGGALRLTVARYYTPSGRCIQRDYSEGETAYYENADKNFDEAGDSSLVDSTEFKTESGRVVYGGGGITPDYTVAIDSMDLDPDYQLLASYIPEFGYTYFRDKHAYFSEMDSLEFFETYSAPDEAITKLAQYVSDREEEYVPKPKSEIAEKLALNLKARLAMLKYDQMAWFKVMNPHDKTVLKSLELVREKVPIAKQD